ncbi:MAG: LysR substrate-binding domain-containing protein [Kiloniellales bacterium]
MVTRLPSLTALRAFEAVGRLGSFTQAAAELNVTQAAVSHQVRLLERQLGASLLTRSTRKIALTEQGARLLGPTTAAFTQLAAAVADVRAGERRLAISTTPGFGARWLAPRLGRFAVLHPDWEITVRHSTQPLDMEREGLLASIRWGEGNWPGVVAELITPVTLVAMASPQLVKTLDIRQPVDLTRATLLHDEDQSEWLEWLLAAGLNPEQARRGLIFDDENALIEAAFEGQGVALLSPELVDVALEEGWLIRLFDRVPTFDSGYYLVYLPSRRDDPRLRAFRDFVLAEGAEARAPNRQTSN